ncbi:winged helix-turn-helix domain-containing tetratricopeptide repeat protein [Bradyrhizobium sp. INPA03-11B]|uniref:winged helix-turn-helix domain-containing tetratricopeptide repeat protein n=1 Tax=Bradyrhizobium sp. INPA03-11B TaxID=418598 RepID=UPI00338F3FB7
MRYFFEDYSLDTERRELRRGFEVVPTTRQVFALLDYFIRNSDRVVSKDDLVDAIWDGRAVSDAAVTTRLNAARHAIGDSGQAQRLIRTLPRQGFRFVGVVQRAQDAPAGSPATALDGKNASPLVGPEWPPHREIRSELDAPSGAPGCLPSVAVLPFANLSGDKEQDYFSDGITEDIITELSRFSELFVIARNSSFTYKGKAVDIRQIGRELGVRYLLEGSIRRDGAQVRITAQLIDALTGAHRWAERYDRELEDIFAVQEEVARTIVAVLADHVYVAELEHAKRKPTENLGAYDLYLRGMAETYRWTKEGNEAALRLFYRAIELDPEFPTPYGAAAMRFAVRKGFSWIVDRDQEIAEVRRLARCVMQLGKNDAIAFVHIGHALGYVAKDLDDGVAMIDRALALNPNLGAAWAHSGWPRLWLGDAELAIEHFARAMRLSPVDPGKFWPQEGTAHAHFFAGRYDEAFAWAAMALRSRPDSHAALRIGAASSVLAGRCDEARRLAARLHEIDPALRPSTLTTVLGPYRNPDDVAKYADALRRAGLPD